MNVKELDATYHLLEVLENYNIVIKPIVSKEYTYYRGGSRRKGRQHRPTGVTNPKAKVTEAEAREIKYQPASVSSVDLSYRFGITPATVGKIRNGHTWKHITKENVNAN